MRESKNALIGLYKVVRVLNPVIYVLVDPREPEHARYVGQSAQAEIRLGVHMAGSHGRVGKWIRRLRSAGITFEMWVLEECALDNMNEREQVWINRLGGLGHNLLNGRDGRAHNYRLRRPS